MKRSEWVSLHCRLLFCTLTVFLLAGNVLALNATDTLQAEAFTGQSGVTTETCKEGGQDVTSIQDGDYIDFNNVDFGTTNKIQCFEARVASYGPGGFIEVHLDSLTGRLVGTCETMPNTGSWQTWATRTIRVSGLSGVHAVYLKFTKFNGTGDLFSLNWIKFHGTPAITTAGWRSTTTSARGKWSGTLPLTSATGTNPTVTIISDTMYQRIDGFGGAFNDNGWHCIDTINRLSPGLGTTVMRELFHPVDGCRFTTGRVPIGMSDFTTTKDYSLDEIPPADTATVKTDYNLTYFTIKHDTLFNIPYVKSAMAFNPNLMIYGSPWTPPQWMKTNNNWQGTSSAKIKMDAQTLTAYAMYLRKFVQAWHDKGISVFVVFPQNEPGWVAGSHPSCGWNGTELRDFCHNYMGPDFKTNNIMTEIWMGTFHMPQFTSYAKPTLDDTVALKYVTGVGFQRAGATGLDSAMAYKPQLHWHSMETETMCWSGDNSWTDAMNTFQYIDSFLVHSTNTYNMWNMILDSNYNYVTWMTRAQNAMVIINPRAKPSPTVKYTGEFYIMKHYSYYISPGAVRIKSTSTAKNPTVCAFKNPDGTIIVEVSNSATSTISPVIKVDTMVFTPTLAASSVNTFILGGNPDTHNWTPGVTTSIQYTPAKSVVAEGSGTLGVYDIKGRLVKLLGRNSANAVWDRTDASGKKATPGMYIIAKKSGNNVSVIQKVMCK